MFITGGDPHRLELLLWLELPEDLIVGHEAFDPSAPMSLAETLLRAMKQPSVGPPHRPVRVRVADEASATELRAAVPGLAVVVAPTPELEAVLEHMTQSMPPGDEMDIYLEEGRVPPDRVAKLFRAAELVWRLAPWKVAYDGQIVFALVVEHPTVRMQHLRDPLRHLRQELRNILVARPVKLHELGSLIYPDDAGHEHSVRHQHLEVQAQLQTK